MIQHLFESENNWTTAMGASFPGERVVLRGKDFFTELKDLSWMQLLIYGITGRKFSVEGSTLIEQIWKIGASYPDPRIWNNRVSSLTGTVRSTAALSAGASIAASDSTIYGQRPIIRSLDLLYRVQAELDNAKKLDSVLQNELSSFRGLPGFGRPIVQHDERIQPLLDCAKSLSLSDGKFVKLVFDVERALYKKNIRLKMNAAALAAALVADLELSVEEYKNLMCICFSAGNLFCYLDASKNKEGTFFPIRCDRISYEGNNIRQW